MAAYQGTIPIYRKVSTNSCCSAAPGGPSWLHYHFHCRLTIIPKLHNAVKPEAGLCFCFSLLAASVLHWHWHSRPHWALAPHAWPRLQASEPCLCKYHGMSRCKNACGGPQTHRRLRRGVGRSGSSKGNWHKISAFLCPGLRLHWHPTPTATFLVSAASSSCEGVDSSRSWSLGRAIIRYFSQVRW